MSQALRWSPTAELDLSEMLAAGLGMAGPLVAGHTMGRLPMGIAASAGALVIGSRGAGLGARGQALGLATAALPAALAPIGAAFVAGHGGATEAAVLLLATAAALLAGYSRPAAAATRFVLFLLITVSMTDSTPDPLGFLALVVVGAVSAALLTLVIDR